MATYAHHVQEAGEVQLGELGTCVLILLVYISGRMCTGQALRSPMDAFLWHAFCDGVCGCLCCTGVGCLCSVCASLHNEQGLCAATCGHIDLWLVLSLRVCSHDACSWACCIGKEWCGGGV
jgi:hypothetical protein